MSFNSLLIHTAIIEVKTFTEDSAGQPIESWATSISNVHCRLDSADGGVRNVPEYIYNRATHILFLLPQSVTLTTSNHRIDVAGVKYEILLVMSLLDQNKIHHLELILQLIT